VISKNNMANGNKAVTTIGLRQCNLFSVSSVVFASTWAPEFYQTGDEPGRQPYVSVVGVRQTGEHTLEFKKSNSPFELLDQQEDGFWRTGIRLDLDRGLNEFPKANFFYPIMLPISKIC